jgi:hypothetical protein
VLHPCLVERPWDKPGALHGDRGVDVNIKSGINGTNRTMLIGAGFGGARSGLYVKSDSVHDCTEKVSIFQEILRAKSDSGASMQFDRRPMALPYPYAGAGDQHDPGLSAAAYPPTVT